MRLLLTVLLLSFERISALHTSLPLPRARVVRMDGSATSPFDEASYEAERLSKDAEAMDSMRKEAEEEFASLRTPWKWVLRKRIWDHMEENDIARQPRRAPPHPKL